MIAMTVQEAQRDFATLLDRVISGEEVIIFSGDKEIAVVSPPTAPSKPRVPGSAKGKMSMSPDFDEPLPDEIQGEFER